jgi:microcystin degradation protein MlrC
MSPKVFLAALAQETNVFGPLPTGLESFHGRFQVAGHTATGEPPFPEALLANLEKRRDAGAIRLVTGPIAGAQPSGLVTRRAYESLRDEIVSQLVASLPVDIVALHLHGAMIAEGYADCEGDLLERVRAASGPRTCIGTLLDPHAHLSARMLETADILVAYKEYPHTDFRERAAELVDLLLRAHYRTVRPCSALWDAGVIGVFHTRRPEARALVELMQAWERRSEALSVSLIHGFPWGDSADLGTRALVITDGDLATAERLASQLAAASRALALQAPVSTTSLDAALAELLAAAASDRPVVWADGADNPGGGAGGDSTYVLKALLESRIEEACLGPLWDPGVVDIAFNLGVGGRAKIRIGGKTGVHSGQPLDVDAEVLALENRGWQTFAGERFRLGRAAALRCSDSRIDLVVTTERDQARGTDLFTNLGIRLAGKRLIVVKSSQHFYDSFSQIASRIVYLDCPGSLQSRLAAFSYQHVERPRWPIDDVAPKPRKVAVRPARTN